MTSEGPNAAPKRLPRARSAHDVEHPQCGAARAAPGAAVVAPVSAPTAFAVITVSTSSYVGSSSWNKRVDVNLAVG